jgi:hypothetical protein
VKASLDQRVLPNRAILEASITTRGNAFEQLGEMGNGAASSLAGCRWRSLPSTKWSPVSRRDNWLQVLVARQLVLSLMTSSNLVPLLHWPSAHNASSCSLLTGYVITSERL